VSEVGWELGWWLLLGMQIPAAAILLSRLIKGPGRYPPLKPQSPTPTLLGTLSIIVPTLNEADRIGPCLAGLSQQGYEVREILIVDSRSQDGTPELVLAQQEKDPRFRLVTDDPLPPGWVGRPWALHTGFLKSSPESEWILGIDADTQPHPQLGATVIQTALAEGYDLISLAPRFILRYPGEIWLQPALLMTLVYRFGPSGTDNGPGRVMANGQCFLCRRSLLERLEGYTSARNSFCDDVTLARYAAAQGARVGFLDGANLLKVRMYEGAVETWREWGRSLDLKDASSPTQIWVDLWFLLSVQGLPSPLAILGGVLWFQPGASLSQGAIAVLSLNLFLVLVRSALCLAIRASYDLDQATGRWLFWLSPLADPLAFIRILRSSFQTTIQWRGRSYSNAT